MDEPGVSPDRFREATEAELAVMLWFIDLNPPGWDWNVVARWVNGSTDIAAGRMISIMERALKRTRESK